MNPDGPEGQFIAGHVCSFVMVHAAATDNRASLSNEGSS